jgi:hypothetical protein
VLGEGLRRDDPGHLRHPVLLHIGPKVVQLQRVTAEPVDLCAALRVLILVEVEQGVVTVVAV